MPCLRPPIELAHPMPSCHVDNLRDMGRCEANVARTTMALSLSYTVLAMDFL
jgi:hypothetical protein